jgi:hypothetical protein
MSNGDKENQHVSISIIQFVANSAKVERDLTNSEVARLRSEVQALREILFAMFKAERKAEKIAFTELQRRLKTLNHAHEEATRDKLGYLPREVFDRFNNETFNPWRDQMNAFQNNLIGKISLGGFLIGIVVILIDHYWKG